jgi:hypothetical protein
VLSKRALNYWSTKSRFKGNPVQEGDWEAFGAAMKAVPAGMQRWISKTTSGFCATGVMMQRRKERPSPACPRCGAPENVEHIWLCKHNTAELWKKALDNLRQWLADHGTHPEVQQTIIGGLRGWLSGDSTFSEFWIILGKGPPVLKIA